MGPLIIFLSKFTTVEMPKKNVPNYQEKLRRSVVGEFNQEMLVKGYAQMVLPQTGFGNIVRKWPYAPAN